MLSLRVLTALILVPPFVLALFYLPSVGVAALLGVFTAAAAWEWAALCGLTRGRVRAGYSAAVVVLGAAGVMFFSRSGISSPPVLFVLAGAVVWWVWIFLELAFRRDAPRTLFTVPYRKVLSGFFILIPAWFATFFLHAADPRSPRVLLFLFVLLWVADTAAYFAGHYFGRVKLAPTVSPGKTVEGVAGGVIAVALLSYFGGTLIWKLDGGRLALWVALAVGTALFSVVGDLVESKFKRVAGVKDSGRLLPGHGGVLDRIDSLTAAAPVFALGWFFVFGPRS